MRDDALVQPRNALEVADRTCADADARAGINIATGRPYLLNVTDALVRSTSANAWSLALAFVLVTVFTYRD